MSAITITQLPEINVTDPNALLVIVTSGTTYKIPFSALTATLIGNTTISGNTTNVGNFSVTGGTVNFGEVIEASDNSDAILSGLTIGDVYRTGDFLKIVHL